MSDASGDARTGAAWTTAADADRIILAHGGGGELTGRLVRDHFVRVLGNDVLATLTDGAVLGSLDGDVVLTTDSYVVQPIEFPGGDIGRLAVCGTVNDLAMMGATPVALSLGVILEEGLSIAVLDRVIASIDVAAREASTRVVTGDTKVIERRGGAAGLMINTAGVGVRPRGMQLGAEHVQVGDAIMLSGRIAEHGLAVLSRREGLTFASTLRSDVAPLAGLVRAVLDSGAAVRYLRDPTRGGVAGVLADLCEDTGRSMEIDEAAVPLSRTARHAAELLGLDPLTIANEGKMVVVVAATDAERALAACRAHPLGEAAAIVGRVTDAAPPLVELVTESGGRRVVQRPYGEELPRIC